MGSHGFDLPTLVVPGRLGSERDFELGSKFVVFKYVDRHLSASDEHRIVDTNWCVAWA